MSRGSRARVLQQHQPGPRSPEGPLALPRAQQPTVIYVALVQLMCFVPGDS